MTAADELLDSVVSDVLETMFFSGVFGPGTQTDGPHLAARVSFTGSHQGALEVAATEATARALAGSFLGVMEDEVPEGQAPALLGEMANVLCGAVLGRMEPQGRFLIAPPEAASGEDPGGVKHVFELAEGWLSVSWRVE